MQLKQKQKTTRNIFQLHVGLLCFGIPQGNIPVMAGLF